MTLGTVPVSRSHCGISCGTDGNIARFRSTAWKILQSSHMELLYELARPEPRLRKLLGHFSVYEDASQWLQENEKNSVSLLVENKEEVQEPPSDITKHQKVMHNQDIQDSHTRGLQASEAAMRSRKPRQAFFWTTRHVMEFNCGTHTSDNASKDGDSGKGFLNGKEQRAADFLIDSKQFRQLRGNGEHPLNATEFVNTKEAPDDVQGLWALQPRGLTENEND